MIYLLCLSVLYLMLSIVKINQRVWLLLSLLYFCLWINTILFEPSDDRLYLVRSVITLVIALTLLKKETILSLYHSSILWLTLLAYCLLAFDVSQGVNVCIYNKYEEVMYGIIILQLLGSFTTIRAGISDFFTNGNVKFWHYKRSGKV